MSDLRRDCTKEIASHLVGFFMRYCDDAPFWPDTHDAQPEAEALFDAILSVLSERADEWYDQTMQDIFGTDPAGWPMATFGPKALLAVLGDT